METPDRNLYEYAVVRFVPRVDRGEFVNIGLIMMCKRRKWLRGEICINPHKVLALDPQADIDTLRRYSSVFERTDVPGADLPVEERYRWLAAVKSAVLQVSPSHPGLLCENETEPSLDAEFERLMRRLVL